MKRSEADGEEELGREGQERTAHAVSSHEDSIARVVRRRFQS